MARRPYRLVSAIERVVGLAGLGITTLAVVLAVSVHGPSAGIVVGLALLAATIGAVAFANRMGRGLTHEIDVARHVLSHVIEGRDEDPNPRHHGSLVSRCHELRHHYRGLFERQREARRRAEVADAYQTEFLTSVSHELRNPLNSILGFTDVLLSEIDGPLSDGQREDLTIIRSAGDHLISLFNDILDLSAASTGRLRLMPESVDPALALKQAGDELVGQRGEKPIEIRVEVAASLPPVWIDPKRLRQVLGNLTSNALKFTRRGEIVLSAEPAGDRVLLRVRDTGDGISESEMDAIFSEFGQGADEIRRHRGSGLGLAISRQLIELAGGELTAESREGEGATFTIALPAGGAKS